MPSKSEASVRWLQSKETTFYADDMKLQERWQYYISSYLRAESTEGVDRERVSKVVLNRNIPSSENDSEDGSGAPKPLSFDENLVVSICLRSAKMVWDAGSAESFRTSGVLPATAEGDTAAGAPGDAAKKNASVGRSYKLREQFIMNNSWMKDLSQEEVEKQKAGYKGWSEEAADVEVEAAAEGGDVDMSG
ncbi:hypothetical protein IMZ48_42440 [Candidatus Bathyarchaeota archaeon]|nr:hypothetical protein [Candidatus Bathyarchaeota archaeon]